jgi:hypothetical protein
MIQHVQIKGVSLFISTTFTIFSAYTIRDIGSILDEIKLMMG